LGGSAAWFLGFGDRARFFMAQSLMFAGFCRVDIDYRKQYNKFLEAERMIKNGKENVSTARPKQENDAWFSH